MTSNDGVEIKLRGRFIRFPAVDGLSELEMNAIIGQVEEKMNRIAAEMHIADTGKLATLAAYDFAVELFILKSRIDTNQKADSGKLEDMIASLEKSLEGVKPS